MSLAETRLPSNLAGEAAGRMWMPFGNPPHPDDALRDTSFDAVLLFPELGEWKAIFDRLAVSGLTRTHIATRARVNGVPLLQGIACVRRGLHPVLVADAVLLSVNLALERVDGTGQSLLLVLDVASICLGYLSFLLLGWTTLSEKERRGFWRVVLFMPVYWLMMSVAAWRALWQLFRDPHRWEKTFHRGPVWASVGARVPSARRPDAACANCYAAIFLLRIGFLRTTTRVSVRGVIIASR